MKKVVVLSALVLILATVDMLAMGVKTNQKNDNYGTRRIIEKYGCVEWSGDSLLADHIEYRNNGAKISTLVVLSPSGRITSMAMIVYSGFHRSENPNNAIVVGLTNIIANFIARGGRQETVNLKDMQE